MLIDFVVLKSLVVDLLKEEYDHKTILQVGDPLSESLDWRIPVRLMLGPPTAENLAQEFLDETMVRLKGQIKTVKVRFWETSNCYAEASF